MMMKAEHKFSGDMERKNTKFIYKILSFKQGYHFFVRNKFKWVLYVDDQTIYISLAMDI